MDIIDYYVGDWEYVSFMTTTGSIGFPLIVFIFDDLKCRFMKYHERQVFIGDFTHKSV